MSTLVSERTKRTGCVSLRSWVEAGEEGGERATRLCLTSVKREGVAQHGAVGGAHRQSPTRWLSATPDPPSQLPSPLFPPHSSRRELALHSSITRDPRPPSSFCLAPMRLLSVSSSSSHRKGPRSEGLEDESSTASSVKSALPTRPALCYQP